jgi:hypothetical protein
MREFKAGTLKSSGGEKITNYKQAVAVALSQAGMSMPKKDASEEYMRAFIKQVLEEEEGMEEEGKVVRICDKCGAQIRGTMGNMTQHQRGSKCHAANEA